jgi:hypothetical protein
VASDNAASLFVCAMRVARLDSDGTPTIGADKMVESDALIKLTWEPDLEAGQEFTLKNGCGDIHATKKKDDQIKALNLSLDLVTPDPSLTEILVGGTVLASGDGYAYPDLGKVTRGPVSVEAWTQAIIDGDVADDLPWIRWVFPKTVWQYGARNAEEAFMGVPFTGRATENANWGNGPVNDWPEISTQVCQHLRVDEDDLPTTAPGYKTVLAS